jgi:hypothetical protein
MSRAGPARSGRGPSTSLHAWRYSPCSSYFHDARKPLLSLSWLRARLPQGWQAWRVRRRTLQAPSTISAATAFRTAGCAMDGQTARFTAPSAGIALAARSSPTTQAGCLTAAVRPLHEPSTLPPHIEPQPIQLPSIPLPRVASASGLRRGTDRTRSRMACTRGTRMGGALAARP